MIQKVSGITVLPVPIAKWPTQIARFSVEPVLVLAHAQVVTQVFLGGITSEMIFQEHILVGLCLFACQTLVNVY